MVSFDLSLSTVTFTEICQSGRSNCREGVTEIESALSGGRSIAPSMATTFIA